MVRRFVEALRRPKVQAESAYVSLLHAAANRFQSVCYFWSFSFRRLVPMFHPSLHSSSASMQSQTITSNDLDRLITSPSKPFRKKIARKDRDLSSFVSPRSVERCNCAILAFLSDEAKQIGNSVNDPVDHERSKWTSKDLSFRQWILQSISKFRYDKFVFDKSHYGRSRFQMKIGRHLVSRQGEECSWGSDMKTVEEFVHSKQCLMLSIRSSEITLSPATAEDGLTKCYAN